MLKRFLLGMVCLAGLTLLTACDSAEERAEKHYQTALEHLEEGDNARAAIEFRNVFKLNGKHKDARLAYARMRRDEGLETEAYGQYLRLVEQYPDNLEGRRALAEMAIGKGDWTEAERHGRAAAEQAPDDPVIRAVLINLDYRDARQTRDPAARAAAVAAARQLTAAAPDLTLPYNVIVSDLIHEKDWPAALTALDRAVAIAPDLPVFYNLRLGVLNEIGDAAAIQKALEEMVARFPEDDTAQAMLLDWHMARGDFDATEAFLRSRIDSADADPGTRLMLIRFLAQTRGPEAAIAEIDAITAQDPPRAAVYRTLRAGLVFEQGEQAAAIAALEDVIESAPSPSQDINDAKVVLARMLEATGNPVGARARVEEVLAEDPGHVAAVKLKAAWQIEDDRTGDAIVLLRAAMGSSPRDAELMTLLAWAHERDGNRDLMAEMMARAVEASGNAPDETIRYASHLLSEGQLRAAETAAIEGLRIQPGNVPLLTLLGRIYIEEKDWARGEGVIKRLREIGAPARPQEIELTAALLAAQGRQDNLLEFLESLPPDDSRGAEIGIVRTHARNGDLDAALDYLDQALETAPEDALLRFLRGSILVADGKPEEGAVIFQALLEEQPQAERIWMALYMLHETTGDAAAAEQVLGEALAALPDSTNLKWIRAGALERAGDIDGAIAVYEDLYALDSGTPVIANNLASLLSTHRDDTESLDRAFRIAKRLRDSSVPQFQDTYGWIAYRRGAYEDALAHLEPAAEAMPGDPAVQYHLAMTYAALGRKDDARALLKQVTKMNPPASLQEVADAEIARLSAADDSN